jgi:hypothetical protein
MAASPRVERTSPRRSKPKQEPPWDVAAQVPEVPYVPLGVYGDWLFQLDGGRHFRAIKQADLKQSTLISLFGMDAQAIFRAYPVNWKLDKITGKWSPVVSAKGFNRSQAIADTVARHFSEGVFDPRTQLRGRGAWLDCDDKGKTVLVLHLGDSLLVGKGPLRHSPLMKLHGFGYPRRPALPRPHDRPVNAAEAPGVWLRDLFGRWRWECPTLAPWLLTGAVAAAMLDGALLLHPILAIGGGALWGSHDVLLALRRVLGSFVLTARKADDVDELAGYDSLPAVILPPGEAPSGVQQRLPVRRPAWTADLGAGRMRMHDGMRFCAAESVVQMGIVHHPHLLELGLSGRAPSRAGAVDEDDCDARRPTLLRRMIDQFPRVSEVYAEWLELLEVQEGRTDLARTLALLLACAWVLERDDKPGGGDFDAVSPDLDRLMGQREPPWSRVLGCLRSVPVQSSPSSQATLLEKVGIAAGIVVVGETPIFDDGGPWTADKAVRHAREDKWAREARAELGRHGVKVLDELPPSARTADDGVCRWVAIAWTAELRDMQLQRMGGWLTLQRQGMGLSTLRQAPKVRVLSTVHFPWLCYRMLAQ